MQTLVTGGSGFLALYLIEQLREEGIPVRALCRRADSGLAQLGVEVVHGDLRNPDDLARAVEGCDTVFHVAAIPGVWGPRKLYFDANFQGTMNLLAACRGRVSKLVFTSTPSVVFDGTPHRGADESLPYARRFLCHYPHSKMLAERAVLAANGQAGLATVALRPHLIWGPRDRHLLPRLIERARRGRLRRIGAGTNRVSVSYVENAAAAHRQAARGLTPNAPHAGRAYFINEPEPVVLWDWIDGLLVRAGLAPVRRGVSAAAAAAAAGMLEFVHALLPALGEPALTRFVVQQLSLDHWYDCSAARRDFGYAPRVPMDEALRRTEPDLRRWAAQGGAAPGQSPRAMPVAGAGGAIL